MNPLTRLDAFLDAAERELLPELPRMRTPSLATDGEAEQRILPVAWVGFGPCGRPRLRVRPTRISQPQALRQVFLPTPERDGRLPPPSQRGGGIFLAGANAQQARQYAQAIAAARGGTVRGPEVHGGGRPHFHIVFPRDQRQRSNHIFYGAPPRGEFFGP